MKFWLQIIKDNQGFGILFFLSLVIITMGLLSPIFIIHIFNRYITFGLQGTLFFLVTGAIIVAILEYIFRNIRHNFFSKIIIKPIKDLKLTILKNFYDSELIDNKKNKSSHILEVLDIHNNISNTLSPNNQSNIIDAFFAFLILLILFFLNNTLASIFLVILIIVIFIQGYFQSQRSLFLNNNKNSFKNSAGIFKDLGENKDFLKSLNIFNFIGSRFSHAIDQQLSNNVITNKSNSHQLNFNHFLIVLNSIIIIGVGSTFVVSGDLTVGTLIGFNIFSSRALQILMSAQKSFINFKNINNYFLVTNEFFKNTEKRINTLQLSKIKESIELNKLDFNYGSNSSFLFRNLSLKFLMSSITNITGSNGSGKTTLCKLIFGIIKQNSGEILIDNTNFEKFSLTWWRDQIGYVPQSCRCLNTSLVDNIRLGNENLNEQEVGRIINSVGLDNALKKSYLDLNTPITNNISLGIHKKIHYARMLASNRNIIILDDPFESLDEEGRELVKQLIISFKRSKKMIICFSNDKEIINLSDRNYSLDD
jgi:ATP-binding cassette, subfamily C, bacterial LapB